MRNAVPLILILLISLPAMFFVGKGRAEKLEEIRVAQTEQLDESEYPNQGSVEILNGCGENGLAGRCATFLREHHFDVKSTGNVYVNGRKIQNYSNTLVISRKKDMAQAQAVARLLGSDAPLFIRTDYNESDVTVILGHNFGEF